ncbi:MAG: L,D-transpeptidase family protein [Anaerolineae bacterium]
MAARTDTISYHRPQGVLAAGLFLILLVALVGATAFCGWVFLARMDRLYRDHIFPNVYALGVNLGGKSPNEAVQALEAVADQVDTGLLVLTDGEQRWSYPWSLAGLQVDTQGTARAAYAIGHEGDWQDRMQVWLTYHDVPPRFLFDTTAAQNLLEELDQEASIPPVDPSIELENGEVVVAPGQPGRVLDIPTTLAKLREAGGDPYRVEVELVFETLMPPELETEQITTEAETFLSRQITVFTYDVLTDETLSWTLDRDDIANWLYLVPGPGGKPMVDVNQYAIQDTLVGLAEGLGDGRGFRYDQAAAKIFEAFEAGEPQVWLYLTHPERTYIVQAGDTLTSLSAKFGMPPGLVAEANRDIDVNKLYVGQEITIPSQDILTPHMPIPEKKIVVSLSEQRTRVYENGQLIYDWVVSTGIESSPTHRGTFQVLEKHEEAYASQWDLWMPYFVAVYEAGGGVENGFHELPILSNGQRLWAGTLGRPASYGCIILGIPDAQLLYDWAEPGVTVVIQ